MPLPRFSLPLGASGLRVVGSLFCLIVAAVVTPGSAWPARFDICSNRRASARPAREVSFMAENDVAMQRMMSGMSIEPSGDVDRDFAAMMIPHHQGAIDMAVAELRYGSNEKLRRLAQEIIVSQQQEIAVMRMAVDQALPPSSPAPTQITLAVPAPQDAHEPRAYQ
jgi:Domain of unknown function (DUF305)